MNKLELSSSSMQGNKNKTKVKKSVKSTTKRKSSDKISNPISSSGSLKDGFLSHLFNFSVVNGFFLVINLIAIFSKQSSYIWFYFITIPWAFALLAHFYVVYGLDGKLRPEKITKSSLSTKSKKVSHVKKNKDGCIM